MLHFDTNALMALPHWARDSHPVVRRVLDGEPAAASSIVWYEFLIGPLAPREVELARAFIQGRIVEVDEAEAELAAQLFNAAGRQRTLKTDAMIAATAIRADAELVTLDQKDFLPFIDHRLRLFDAGLTL